MACVAFDSLTQQGIMVIDILLYKSITDCLWSSAGCFAILGVVRRVQSAVDYLGGA